MRFVSWIVLMWIVLILGNFACENCEIKRMSVIKRNYIHNTAKEDRFMCVVFDFLPHTWKHTHTVVTSTTTHSTEADII